MKHRLCTINSVLFLSSFLLLMACARKHDLQNTVKYDLEEIAQSAHLWTGVAVSREGRIFVNYPRWSEKVPFAVAEITASGEAGPFPNEAWNNWNPALSPDRHFVCVQSVYIDRENYLWILDPANAMLRGVVAGGAKLVKIDLRSDQVIQIVRFDSTIAPKNSYLNDVRVDTRRGYAYLTDSGAGALVVVDLNTRRSHRLLANHPSTKAEAITLQIAGKVLPLKVHADGLALDADGEYLYYQALTGRTLYRIKTEYLRDRSLAEAQLEEKVEVVGQSGASDGLAFKEGQIYLTSIEDNAIRCMTPTGQVELVVQDPRLQWPDTFSIAADGTIYVTTSRISYPPGEPCRLFKLRTMTR